MKVTLICAVSHDGFIARGPADSLDWVPKSNMRYFAKATKKIGVVIMGANTRMMIPRPLEGRVSVILSQKLGGPMPESPQQEVYTNASPKEILDAIALWGYSGAAVTGGTQVNTLFLQAGLIDELRLSRVPVNLGCGFLLFGEQWNHLYRAYDFVPMPDKVWLVKYRRSG